ncbi:MAG: adenosylcobinamide-GDP ribazoletransferase [Ferruginibacter sp.]|nr:adenosylcobinamide-GDP ribazoletransferase [Cytophagales bacterium]
MKNQLRQQVRLFFTAVMFYTRLPCPAWVGHSADYLPRATVYLPVIGWIVGGWTALVYTVCALVLGVDTAVVLSMIAGVWLTGAFHEDGWADVCDGFGGGWTKLRILAIMKDSRVGAYGAIGLVLMLMLKFFSLRTLAGSQLVPALLVGHSLSRTTALTLIYSHAYVRENEDSKAKPVAKGLHFGELCVALGLGLLPLAGLVVWQGQAGLLLVLIPLLGLKLYLGWYFTKWIGGYTGDCLGATQQLAEVVTYLFFNAQLTMNN